MSTYDAYNLSLRDSTEFTVPTGGGNSGDSQFELVNVTFVNNSISAIAFSCSAFLNDPQFESVTGFAKIIATHNGVNAGNSIATNMLIPTDGATICVYESPAGVNTLTINATGDIRTIDNQNFIIVYGSGTVTFVDDDGSGGGK